MEVVKAWQEGASDTVISLYIRDVAFHMRAGVNLEGIQWGHQGDWSLEDVAYGERWKELSWRRLEWTKQQPTVTWRAGTEDGLKLAPALTNNTTRGNSHKLQVGCLHQEKHLL